MISGVNWEQAWNRAVLIRISFGQILEEPDITAENLLLKQQALKCVSQMSDRVTGIMMLLNMYLNTIL